MSRKMAIAMTRLVVTDIRKSNTLDEFDLLTAVILDDEEPDKNCSVFLKGINRKILLILESAIAEQAIPDIGVQKGDQFLRIRANSDHGLVVGEELRF